MDQPLILSIIIGLLIVGLFMTKVKPTWLFLGAIGLSYFTGLIELDTIVVHYANPSLVTLVLLILVSISLEKTYLIQYLIRTFSQGSLRTSVTKLAFSSAFLSSFINNTAVVSALISAIKDNPTHAPSKLLLPLSYSAILGGTLTLIGTSTNLIVNSFVIDAGLPALNFFDFTLIGLAAFVTGFFVILLLVNFLPNYAKMDDESVTFYLEAYLPHGSILAQRTLENAQLMELKNLSLKGIALKEIIRGGESISVSDSLVLQEKDRLVFVGNIQSVSLICAVNGLQLGYQGDTQSSSSPAHMSNCQEVVISHSSKLINHTLQEVQFNDTFHATVIAIRRGHEQLKGRISQIRLQAGDSLILAPLEEFYQRPNLSREFVYLSGVDLQAHLRTKQSHWVLAGFALILLMSIFNLLPLVKGLLLLMVAFLFTQVLTLNEIQRRFPVDIFLIVGSAIGLAKLMIDTGLAARISQFMLNHLEGFGVYSALIAVFLLTLFITELITNNAAAALSFPIAYSLSVGFNADPMPFIMAVAYGASASFISPFGYQTNLMVYSAGNYRIRDYIRFGLPLSIVYSFTILIMLPLVFPFYPSAT